MSGDPIAERAALMTTINGASAMDQAYLLGYLSAGLPTEELTLALESLAKHNAWIADYLAERTT